MTTYSVLEDISESKMCLAGGWETKVYYDEEWDTLF